ncbi:MAG: HEPN domain-containing protein [Magnetococcales bacterium]|nr:HEPN domain-containing protein [Magnetococcales bacterium]MBF0114204.1 HEPN domain-containing protein [Magnetococcales bacterium]
MPPDKPIPGTPLEWLQRARGDLALARVVLPEGGFYADLCFHAQQAAEKAVKAIFRFRNKGFRKRLLGLNFSL